MKSSSGVGASAEVDCRACGANGVRESMEVDSFAYGAGKDAVVLTARVPVLNCSACGARLTDARAEDIRHEAVCRHLGRITPAAVREIRERNNFSQEEWAELTGFGIASIKRWETGALIQNEAADRYLRLLSDPDVLAKLLRQVAAPVVLMPVASAMSGRENKFKTLVREESRRQAKTFHLVLSALPRQLEAV